MAARHPTWRALLTCALLLPWRPARGAAGCGPGGVAPGGGAPYACTSTAADLPPGVKLYYDVDEGARVLRLALQTPGRGWVALAFTTADNAGVSASSHRCTLLRSIRFCVSEQRH